MEYQMVLKERIAEQAAVYETARNGELSLIRYERMVEDGRGTYDRNHTARERLCYYLLYEKIDDESLIETLFEEELKDRQSDSFQGIGETLKILTFLLQRYNRTGKYRELFEKAKNANFDCACGYDEHEEVADSLEALGLTDCIYLSHELRYTDILEQLIEEWKRGIREWNEKEREQLIRYNCLAGKNSENEEHYISLLGSAKESGKVFDIVSAYNRLIKLYISVEQFELAYSYMREMIDTTDFREIQMIRLFSAVLEECFEIVCGSEPVPTELWEWAKKYLLKMEKRQKFGNLYEKSIAAAKRCADDLAGDLEKEYDAWKKEMSVR